MRTLVCGLTLATFTVVLTVFASTPAAAAPQVLALVATGGEAVDLTCDGSDCSAEFSTFCLQPDRFSPKRGTAYRLAENGGIRLIGTTEDGRAVTLDPRPYLKFETMRSHVAMRISVSRRQIDAIGLASVAVSVGDGVTLLPVSSDGTAAGNSDAELAMLTGPLRSLGSRIVDRNSDRMVAARITNRLINSLPTQSREGIDRHGGLWAHAADKVKTEPALRLARDAVELCNFAVTQGGFGTMRRCLQSKHDSFVDYLNSDYWKAVKTGS